MPEGQYSGSRSKYEYTSDGGTTYKLLLDDTLATLAGTDLVAAAPDSTAIPKPTNFKPRVVFWQGELGGVPKRKDIVCNPTSTLYAVENGQALSVDGVAGVVTGRRGEKLTF